MRVPRKEQFTAGTSALIVKTVAAFDNVRVPIPLIATQRDCLRAVGMRFNHLHCRQPFGMAHRTGSQRVHDQAVAVFHQRVPYKQSFVSLLRPFS